MRALVKPSRGTFDRGSHRELDFCSHHGASKVSPNFSVPLGLSFDDFPIRSWFGWFSRHGNCFSKRSGYLLRNRAFYALRNDSQQAGVGSRRRRFSTFEPVRKQFANNSITFLNVTQPSDLESFGKFSINSNIL